MESIKDHRHIYNYVRVGTRGEMGGTKVHRVTKVLVTVGTGPMLPVLDLALRTFRPYAERHGYDLVIGSGDANGREPAWAKVVLLRRLLAVYDEALWLDSDILILDGSKDIADSVPAGHFQGLVEQAVSEKEHGINTGVWFLRAGPASTGFLDAVWDHDATGEPGMWENLQALDLLGYTTVRPYRPIRQTEWLTGTALLDPTWNAIGGIPGRFRHYSAMSNAYRRRVMGRDLASGRIERLVRSAELAAYERTRHRRNTDRYFDRRIAGDGEP
jgi:hypothetical protein